MNLKIKLIEIRRKSMSLIGKTIENFVTDAYQEGKFLTVNSEDFKGKWQVIVF